MSTKPDSIVIENFSSFGLPQPVVDALERLEFKSPTPIQAQVIPHALAGKDILGSAQTGTGKTAAFGIPLISHLIQTESGDALIITPTRELAVQVLAMIEKLIDRKHQNAIKTALLIGGEPIFKQLHQLRRNPRLLVGTPGRITDHVMRGSVSLENVRYLVLDETDRMLDMGFAPQIEQIAQYIPKERQTLLFSATLPKNIVKLSENYLNEPVRVSIGATTATATNIKQEVVYTTELEKHDQLTSQLDQREGSIIIFVKTKIGAKKMALRLRKEHHSADAIHGDLNHSKRERAISAFRDSKYRIMVATDVAARGLDISHVKHVINYDLPQCPEDYIHRIGRTARAGAEGSALCFVTPGDKRKWYAINALINPDQKQERFDHPRGGSSRDGGGRSFGGRRSSNGGGSRFGGGRSGERSFSRDGGDRDSRGGGSRFGGRSSSSGERSFSRDSDRDSRGGSEDRGGFRGTRDSSSSRGEFSPRDRDSRDSSSRGGDFRDTRGSSSGEFRRSDDRGDRGFRSEKPAGERSFSGDRDRNFSSSRSSSSDRGSFRGTDSRENKSRDNTGGGFEKKPFQFNKHKKRRNSEGGRTGGFTSSRRDSR